MPHPPTAHSPPASAAAPAEDIRCECGCLIARQTPEGIEVFCRRCRSRVLLAAQGWTPLSGGAR